MSEIRLGDILDDYCSKCRRIENHSVVSIVNGQPAKVECRTCYYSHKYRHGKAAAKKKPSEKAELFEAVLAKIAAPPSSESNSKPRKKN